MLARGHFQAGLSPFQAADYAAERDKVAALVAQLEAFTESEDFKLLDRNQQMALRRRLNKLSDHRYALLDRLAGHRA